MTRKNVVLTYQLPVKGIESENVHQESISSCWHEAISKYIVKEKSINKTCFHEKKLKDGLDYWGLHTKSKCMNPYNSKTNKKFDISENCLQY